MRDTAGMVSIGCKRAAVGDCSAWAGGDLSILQHLSNIWLMHGQALQSSQLQSVWTTASIEHVPHPLLVMQVRRRFLSGGDTAIVSIIKLASVSNRNWVWFQAASLSSHVPLLLCHTLL